MLDFIRQPWSWWFSGMVISGIMFALLYFGQSFGFSSNLRTLCTIAGAGKKVSFFNFNWKTQSWNLVFLAGSITGGFLTKLFLTNDVPVEISLATLADLSKLGFSSPTGMLPEELFGLSSINLKNILILLIGGLMVGFGSRYAGGCTSGHAISGLSDLQLPSLVAVLGFFAGGLLMTHILFPLIF